MFNGAVSNSDYVPMNVWIVGNTGLDGLEKFNGGIPMIYQKKIS
jgi:hypothetical protein